MPKNNTNRISGIHTTAPGHQDILSLSAIANGQIPKDIQENLQTSQSTRRNNFTPTRMPETETLPTSGRLEGIQVAQAVSRLDWLSNKTYSNPEKGSHANETSIEIESNKPHPMDTYTQIGKPSTPDTLTEHNNPSKWDNISSRNVYAVKSLADGIRSKTVGNSYSETLREDANRISKIMYNELRRRELPTRTFKSADGIPEDKIVLTGNHDDDLDIVLDYLKSKRPETNLGQLYTKIDAEVANPSIPSTSTDTTRTPTKPD